MGIRLWKVGVKESKISGSEHKFVLQKKRKRISQACLDMKSKFALLSFASQARFGSSRACICLNCRKPSSRNHCDRSSTNWLKHASSPLNYLTTLSSDVHWKLSHMHPDATSTFKWSWFLSVIWKTSKVFFFFLFFFISKPPWRGWLHGIHHHASLMTSGQEHGVKSQ